MIHIARWKILTVFAICVLGVLYAAPNLFNSKTLEGIPSWLPNKQINLGLDLQGGAHLLLEVDTSKVRELRLESYIGDVRQGLRGAKPPIRYRGLGKVGANAIRVCVLDAADLDTARQQVRRAADGTEITVDGNCVRATLTEETLRDIQSSTLTQSMEIVRKRIDELGTREPTIQRQGGDRIILQLPGESNTERIKKLLQTDAVLTFHLLCPQISPAQPAPLGCTWLQSSDEKDASGNPIRFLVRKKVEVGGSNLVDAQGTFQESQPVVSFRFDSAGARRFCRITRNNVQKPFAIVLDNEVISAPVIREPICGGSGIISGRFTVQGANDLAVLLRAGALPAKIVVIEERTVGPGLGADSITAGKIASIGAIILVVLFMAFAYGGFGLMSDVALAINMVLIAGALSILQATLTLPGIAGIVLTVGMAVDANVLIFERIREEQRNGRTPISAVDAGFQRAIGTIIDANITTLLAAILLYSFGSGPVKGFAVTLAIGLVTSMFTAVMVTRLMVVTWLRRARPQRLPL